MHTTRMLMLTIALAAVIGLATAGVIVVVTHSSSPSATDSALETTLRAIKSDLDKPGALPVKDPTLQSFQAWVYNTRATFQKSVHHETGHQFAQVVLNDPNTMPPQTLGLNQAGHPVIGIPTSAIAQAFKSTDPQCGYTAYNGRNLRFCTTALNTPGALRSSSASGLLTVLVPKR